MPSQTVRRPLTIALASPRTAATVEEGLDRVRWLVGEAAGRGAEVVCFPEAYLPGLRGLDFDVPPFGVGDQERAVRATGDWAKRHRVAVVLGTEWHTPRGRHIAAAVVGPDGTLLGVQTKNQLDPSEDPLYAPGDARRVFEVNGVKFGVAICHEGFRYPETVRWAAARGAKVVFHPHCTGSDRSGPTLAEWGAASSPYYEKAMGMRARENTIYFASVNYAFRYQESATSLVGPDGACVAHLPYGEEGVLVETIDAAAATGLLASRFAPERYREAE